jgi:hypothetical protein
MRLCRGNNVYITKKFLKYKLNKDQQRSNKKIFYSLFDSVHRSMNRETRTRGVPNMQKSDLCIQLKRGRRIL